MKAVHYMIDERKHTLFFSYSAIQAFYWAGNCCICGFATAFLQNCGFSNSLLGLVLALGDLGGFLLAPFLAGIIDKSKRISVFHCVFGMLIAELALEITLAFSTGNKLLTGFVFGGLIVLCIAVNPLNTDICFTLDRSGKYINYGVSRAFGALSYAVVSLTVGSLFQSLSSVVLPIIGSLAVVLQICILLYIIQIKTKFIDDSIKNESEKNAVSLAEFVARNKRFMFFCFGTMILYFSASIPSSFLINVIRSVGGDVSDLGRISFIAELSQMPIMLLYTRMTRNIHCSTALRISFILFIIKQLIFVFAESIGTMYIGSIVDAFSYALLSTALVDYSSIEINYSDMAKGQAVSAAMLTLGSVFANQFGGILFDNLTVKKTMIVTLAFCVLGSAVCFFAVDRKTAQ